MCALSPVVFAAAMVGISVAALTGSTGAGWAAGAVVAAVLYLVVRRRGAGMCTLPAPRARPFEGLSGAGPPSPDDRAVAAPGAEPPEAQRLGSGDGTASRS